MKRYLLLLTPMLALAGCDILAASQKDEFSGDIVKAIESAAYDRAVDQADNVCKKMRSKSYREETIQTLREIRQRGSNGPDPVSGVTRTARGHGPVLVLWCEGEQVPIDVWQFLEKEQTN